MHLQHPNHYQHFMLPHQVHHGGCCDPYADAEGGPGPGPGGCGCGADQDDYRVRLHPDQHQQAINGGYPPWGAPHQQPTQGTHAAHASHAAHGAHARQWEQPSQAPPPPAKRYLHAGQYDARKAGRGGAR